MLTPNFVGDNIGDYYSTEDYYQQREDKTGELLGAGVKSFGFDPTQRQHDQFIALVSDRVGVTKKDGTYEQPRKALDLTFSTPKSVSILYGLAIEAGDHELAQQLVDNQKEAVRQTLRHMEEEGYFTTLVKDADGNVHRYKAVDLVFEMVETHLDNRDGQLQMHVHALAANKCHAEGDPSGQERAVDFGYVFNNQKNIDFIEKQYEAAGIEKMGFSVEMLRDKKGNESFRVAGITAEEEKVYSKRRAAIEESIKTRLGKSIDQATAKEREYANLITRKSKKKDKSIDEMAKGWKADHVAAGLSLDIILDRNRELIAQRSQGQATFIADRQQQDFLQQQQQQQEYQQQEYQQQQYQQQQADQAEQYRRQQTANQAAQQRQEADRRRAQERREHDAEVAHAQAEAEAMRPGVTRDLSYSGKPAEPEAAPRPELEVDYGGFSHGSHGMPGSDPLVNAGWGLGMGGGPSMPGARLEAPDITPWEKAAYHFQCQHPETGSSLPPLWPTMSPEQRASIREIMDLPRPGYESTRPMVWRTGLENVSLPPNWLAMTDPEREAWRRDQLSHDPGPEVQYQSIGGPVPAPSAPGIIYNDTPDAAPLDPKKEIMRQALQDCEDLRGVWTAQAAYSDARKAAIAQNISLDLDEFRKQFDALRGEKGIIDLPGQDESWLTKRYTTQAVLDADRYIQHVARNENKYDTKLIDPERAAKYTEEFSVKLQAENGYPLLSDQVNAVKHIAENSDKLVTGIQGRAGTGKSTGVALLVADKVGRDKVTCLATAAAAAGNLGEAVQVDDAKTIASFVKKYEKGDEATLAKLQDGVIILDEAGMTGSVEMARVIKIAQENNARVVLIGDTDQLAPVSAGCPFLELQERASEGVGMQTAELRQIVRQKDAAAREAVLHVVDGATKEALDYLIDTNQIEEIKEKSARYKEIIGLKTQGLVEDFISGRDIASGKEKSDYLCMVSTNTARDKINNGVRQSLQQQGALDKTQDRTFTIADKDGNEFEKKFAPGDHIIFLQNDNKIGIHNSDLAQIQSIEDKSITAKLASGDVVSFNADLYNRFDYGYALTTYKAQGATQRRAIYDADSKSPLLNKNEFYVGLSRFTEEVHIFTDSKRKMAAKIQRSQEKRSALAEYEKGQAREQGHPYVEAVETAHERRKSADQDTKEKQRRLTHSYQGDYRRVPKEFRDFIDHEFENHRKQLSDELKAAKDKFGDKKDSVTKDMNAAIDRWHENHEKIKVDGYRAEAEAKKKGQITKEERQAKKDAGSMPEWQREWLNRDPDARARAEHQKLVNSARRSHQSLDTRLAAMHQANDKALEKKLTEYTPRRQLADELKRREELAKAKSNDPVIAAKDRPAHLEAERKAAAIFEAIKEAEKVQKTEMLQTAAEQRAAKDAARQAGRDFTPEENKQYIQQYQAINAKYRESVKQAVIEHCDSPEAGQAITDALDRWQEQQNGIKKQSTKNVKEYLAVRDRKPAPSKAEASNARAAFELQNEKIKKLYKANKAQLDKTFSNIKTYIKETELAKYYDSQGRTAPEATVKPIRSKDANGKETVSFRSPDQSARKSRSEKEIGDLVSEFRSLTEKPKHPFMRDLAATRSAWEADRRAINADKAKELEALREKDSSIKELSDERQKHYRDRHANATGLFRSRVEELVAKHGGDAQTAKRVMDSLKSWESRQLRIRQESSALYRDPDGKTRTPSQEEKAAIVEKYRNNDRWLDKDFDSIRKELDSIKKEKKKSKGKDIGAEKAAAIPEKLQNEKNELTPEPPKRDPKQIAAKLDQALRADEDRFFSEIDAATKDGIHVDIPDRKAQVQGILVGQLKGKDGKNYAIIASGNGNYSAVPATGDIRSMLGKPVLAGRNGITPQGSPTPGSNEINKFMLARPLVAKQFGAKLGKMMQRLLDEPGKKMELSI